ncbi:gamma-secretase subunit Aph-1-like [Haemaphysalis longicornis]
MTLAEGIGCSLITFGPALAAFWLTVVNRPSRLVVFLVSAFFWLLSLLLSSLVWYLLHLVLGDGFSTALVVSVGLQEVFRVLAFQLVCKAERMLNVEVLVGVEDDPALARYRAGFAYASGLGFGVASAAVTVANTFFDAAAVHGTLGFVGGSRWDYVTLAATSSASVLLHTFWSVVAFYALLHRRLCLFWFVPNCHVLVSVCALLNSPLYEDLEQGAVSMAVTATAVLVSAVVAFVVAGGSAESVGECCFPSKKAAAEDRSASLS